MKTKLISVVLPTYNVVRYLGKCLDSLIEQTYSNIEILVVIDGATDGSHELAQEYEKKDSRIRVIYQENAGSGPARNNGIINSKGEFITFVDPDDWVKPDFVDELVSLQSKGDYDLVVTGSEAHVFENGSEKSVSLHSFSKEEYYNSIEQVRNRYNQIRFVEQQINAPWAKLFRASIIKENEVRFPDLRRSQDIYFNGEYYKRITSMIESTYCGYCYRVIHGEFAKVRKDYFKISEVLFNQYKSIVAEWGIEPDMSYIYRTSLLNIISNYESLLSQKDSLDDINASAYVIDVLNNGKSSNPYHKIMQFCLKKKLFLLARIAIYIKYKLK